MALKASCVEIPATVYFDTGKCFVSKSVVFGTHRSPSGLAPCGSPMARRRKEAYTGPIAAGGGPIPLVLTTTSLLRSLGAVDDPVAISDGDAAVKLQIGSHWVHGGDYMSRWFKPTYRITAVINTSRSISPAKSEMPAKLETEEEGWAWLAAILGKSLPADAKPPWLLNGERLAHLLRDQTSRTW